jgi:hypothetical protein
MTSKRFNQVKDIYESIIIQEATSIDPNEWLNRLLEEKTKGKPSPEGEKTEEKPEEEKEEPKEEEKEEPEEEKKEKGYYHIESSYGSFRRELTLPTDVDPGKIDAVCKDGVLTINLPKAASAKAVKVKVKG